MKNATGTQVNFILKIQLEKSIFSKIRPFYKHYCGFFEPTIRMGLSIFMTRLNN